MFLWGTKCPTRISSGDRRDSDWLVQDRAFREPASSNEEFRGGDQGSLCSLARVHAQEVTRLSSAFGPYYLGQVSLFQFVLSRRENRHSFVVSASHQDIRKESDEDENERGRSAFKITRLWNVIL